MRRNSQKHFGTNKKQFLELRINLIDLYTNALTITGLFDGDLKWRMKFSY